MAIHHPLTLPRHSGKLLILFLHVKVVHSGATFHSVETAGMSRYTTIPAVTETTRTVRQYLKRSGLTPESRKLLTLHTFMLFSLSRPNSILWYMPTRSFCMRFYTDAPLKHFWNCHLTESISEQHPALSRFFIHGNRLWITIHISTALLQVVVWPKITGLKLHLANFSFLWMFWVLNSVVNSLPAWILINGRADLFSILHVKDFITHTHSHSTGTDFIKRNGVLT